MAVHKMLIEFEPDEYREITARADAETNGSRRAWVMKTVRKTLAVKTEASVLEHWVFKLKDGRVLQADGYTVGDAWKALGYTMGDVELIEAREVLATAQELGWFQKTPEQAIVAPAAKQVATSDDLPFGT